MADRVIGIAWKVLLGFMLIHVGFIIFAQTGHEIREPAAVLMFANAACAIAAWIALIIAIFLKRY